MKIFFFTVFYGLAALTVNAEEKFTYRPSAGYVPDEKTASLIAEAVLKPIYGDKKINSEKPFLVSLNGDIWRVKGSLRKGLKGGVAEVEISKIDGTILRLMHGK